MKSLNTEVTGFSYHTAEITESRLNGIHAPENGRIQILLAHGGDAAHLPLDKAQLAKSGFSYTALGHIHKPEIAPDRSYAWCGSQNLWTRQKLAPMV